MTTRRRASGATSARRSFCMGLPPQSTRTASPSPTKTIEVVSRSRAGTAAELPRNVKCTASGGGAGPAEEHGHADQGEGHPDHARELGDTNGTEHEGVRAEGFGHEATHGIETEVGEEEGAGSALEAPAKHEEEKEEDEKVPDRLVEERRMEILVLGELDGPVRRGDEEPPWEIRGRAECLLVEKVPPAADGLSHGYARRRDIEIGDGGQSPQESIAATDEQTTQDAAVYGEAAFPYREDFSRKTKVVVKIEGDVIEAGAAETPQPPH